MLCSHGHLARTLIARVTIMALLLVGIAPSRTNAQTITWGNGNLVCWGQNDYGQVSGVPSGIFVDVGAGQSHSVALRSDGTVHSWGRDDNGQVSGTPAGTFTDVAAGAWFSVAIRTGGTLAAWGDDGWGQVSGTPAGTYTAVSAGAIHAVAIRTDGTLVSWGDNSWGQVSNTPMGTFVAVAAGFYHSIAIRTDGTLVAWGNHTFAPPGTFSAVAPFIAIRTDGSLVSWAPGVVPTGSFVAAAFGNDHRIAIRTDGTLAAWGVGDYWGEISLTPTGLFDAVAAGNGHSVAVLRWTNQPPVITCNGAVALWSPNHELADVSEAIGVSDPDGDPVTLTFRVFSDETEIPDTGDGTGKHAPDFKTMLASGVPGLFVRSERRGTEDGRFYVVVATADDGHGGVTRTACIAAVCPHNQTTASLDAVLAQSAFAAAQVQILVDADMLPPPGQAPPGLTEHGLAAPQGPFQ